MKISDFRREPSTGVYFAQSDPKFDYSDGEAAEQHILNSLKECADVSVFSSELRTRIIDWPSEYHFSWERHNLLRQIPFSKDMRVLELGAGCGAITRQLGESGARVDAIEGSAHRAVCVAERCRELDNVTVICANFFDLDFESNYDFVLLIGVLEYSAQFVSGEDPYSFVLQRAHAALRPGGVLVLAIENQLGLKYLAGYPEDHVSLQYFGIEDRYTKQGIRTFGRATLKRMLTESGFSTVEFHYPFPDYKLPRCVFSERSLKLPDFRIAEIISSLHSRDYARSTKPAFAEQFSYPVIWANGLLPDMANSFLILASKNNDSKIQFVDRQTLGFYYTTNRTMPLNTSTRFFESTSGSIIVEKKRLCPGGNEVGELMLLVESTEEYVSGANLDLEIDRELNRGNFDRVRSLIRMWLDFLTDGQSSYCDIEMIRNQELSPKLIDATPNNFQLKADGLVLIDREWVYREPFQLRFLWVKWLYEKIRYQQTLNLNRVFPEDCRQLELISRRLGLSLNDADLLYYFKIQFAIREAVFGQNLEPQHTLQEINAVLSGKTSWADLQSQRLSLANRVLRRLLGKVRMIGEH